MKAVFIRTRGGQLTCKKTATLQVAVRRPPGCTSAIFVFLSVFLGIQPLSVLLQDTLEAAATERRLEALRERAAELEARRGAGRARRAR